MQISALLLGATRLTSFAEDPAWFIFFQTPQPATSLKAWTHPSHWGNGPRNQLCPRQCEPFTLNTETQYSSLWGARGRGNHANHLIGFQWGFHGMTQAKFSSQSSQQLLPESCLVLSASWGRLFSGSYYSLQLLPQVLWRVTLMRQMSVFLLTSYPSLGKGPALR